MKRVLQITAILLATGALLQTASQAFAGKLRAVIERPQVKGEGGNPGP